jgi:uncharacterized membrane protein YkoI
MNRKSIAAWTLATIVSTTGALTAVAGETETEREEKVSYTSSIQVTGNPSKADLEKLAKIRLEDAIRSAQGAAAGQVSEAKLENEEKNLVYTIEISNGTDKKEVIVDAGNGAVLAVDADNDKDNGDVESDGDGEHENR